MIKKILITGASGFFGRSVLEALVKSPGTFEVICTFNKSKIDLEDPRIIWVKCNLFDRLQVQKVMSEFAPTHCLHLAWDVPPETFWTSEKNIEWIKASTDLFSAFAQFGGEVFIGAGTIAEYGNTDFLPENSDLNHYPDTLYGQSKKTLKENICSIRDTQFKNTKIIWPRIGYFFGSEEPKNKFFKRLVNSLLNNQDISLASPKFSRPYADVRHFGAIMLKILGMDHREDSTFNFCASVNRSIEDIANFACNELRANYDLCKYDTYTMPTPLPLKTSIENNFVEIIYGDIMDKKFWNDFKNYIDGLR